MAEFKQNSDGSVGIVKETNALECFRAGGPAPTGLPGAGFTVPAFHPGSTMKMGAFAGLTATTGGAIGAWTNNLGYDIIVTSVYVDVTTASTGAANLTAGQTPTSVVTSSSNLLAAVSVASTGIKPSALAAKVKQGEFITLQGSADTTGLVFNFYADYVPA